MKISNEITVRTKVYLGDILPNDVSVQVYSGYAPDGQSVSEVSVGEMHLASKDGDNYVFEGKILIDKVGKCGYTICVLPQYEGEVQILPGLIKWL